MENRRAFLKNLLPRHLALQTALSSSVATDLAFCLMQWANIDGDIRHCSPGNRMYFRSMLRQQAPFLAGAIGTVLGYVGEIEAKDSNADLSRRQLLHACGTGAASGMVMAITSLEVHRSMTEQNICTSDGKGLRPSFPPHSLYNRP